MPTMISEILNGPEDVYVFGNLFEEAAKKKSAEELIAYIASPNERKPTTSITTSVRVATKTSVSAVIKDEAGNAKADGDDESEIAGETSLSTSGNKNKKRKVSKHLTQRSASS